MFMTDTVGRRRVFAPSYDGGTVIGEVLEIWLNPDERVEWIWTTYPDGTKDIIGYNITKIYNQATEADK